MAGTILALVLGDSRGMRLYDYAQLLQRRLAYSGDNGDTEKGGERWSY